MIFLTPLIAFIRFSFLRAVLKRHISVYYFEFMAKYYLLRAFNIFFWAKAPERSGREIMLYYWDALFNAYFTATQRELRRLLLALILLISYYHADACRLIADRRLRWALRYCDDERQGVCLISALAYERFAGKLRWRGIWCASKIAI